MAASKVEKILEAVLSHANRVIDVDRFYVALYNQATIELDFPLAVRKANGKLKRLGAGSDRWASRPYRPSEWLPDYVFANGESILLETEADFEGWLREKELDYRTGYEEERSEDQFPLSWLGIPLGPKGRVAGVIVVESYKREGVYDAETRRILSAMANQAAGTLANVRLVERLRAVNEVGQTLTSSVRLSVDEILDLIYEQASQLMDTRNMYVALYDAPRQELSFPLALYKGEQEDWPSRKVDIEDETKGGLTEEVIRAKETVCPIEVETWYTERGIEPPVPPIPKSWLGVPLITEDEVLGVIALLNDDVENLYGQDDQEVLQAMANQASVALANARLVEKLRAVNEVGQRLTSNVRLSEEEVLDLIHEQASRLMDTRNMYVALYDAQEQELSFPLALYKGEREDWSSRKVDIEDETEGGLTEEVIRAKEPVCPTNVKSWFTERGIDPPVPPIPKSWLGVPLITEDKVLGIIALQNDDVENLYGQDDRTVLQAMAGQASVAIENARIYSSLEEANKRIASSQEMLTRTTIAADFVHRMRNLAGTIPIWTDLLRKEIDSIYKKSESYLQEIEADTNNLLRAAEKLQSPPREEYIDVTFILEAILRQVKIQYGDQIVTKKDIQPNLYQVYAVSSRLANAFWCIIANGIEAMPEGGKLYIRSINQDKGGKQWVRVEIKDEGVGIPADNLSNIFEPFYTTKRHGQGYGLWSAKLVIEQMGGNISVKSQEGVGTTFIVQLPARGEAKQ